MVLKKLESVANMIDENGITYPMLADGGYDIFCGVHVSDIENEEWFNALSKEDIAVVEEHYRSQDGTYKDLKPFNANKDIKV